MRKHYNIFCSFKTREEFIMKIITFEAIKGGVGKTTLTYNFGSFLARTGNKVLLLDLDHQCNLSEIYHVIDTDTNVGNIFTRSGEVKIHDVAPNISLIAGNLHLDDIERSLENQTSKNMLLYLWLADNYNKLNLDQFDYLLIDCHPDFSTATKNAIIISDVVLSPITPSEHGYLAKFNLESRIEELRKEAIDFATRKTYVTAEVLFLLNRIRPNTRSSRELTRKTETDESIIATIPERELFNRSTLDHQDIFKLLDNPDVLTHQRKFKDEIEAIFKQIAERISK
jgi:virC1 protein